MTNRRYNDHALQILMKGGLKMAVTAIPVSSRLQLRLNTGLDENLNPIYRNRSYSRIKATADNEDLFELAEEMAYLQIHDLEAVRRLDEVELVED
jgi:hypothetical protein